MPDDWLIQTAHGRYEETTFEFQFENTASADLYVRLLGQRNSEYDAVYTIEVVIDDGEEHSVTAETCTSEREAMETTQEFLHYLQRSICAEGYDLDELDVKTLETIVGRFRYGVLRFRIRTFLDTFQNSPTTD